MTTAGMVWLALWMLLQYGVFQPRAPPLGSEPALNIWVVDCFVLMLVTYPFAVTAGLGFYAVRITNSPRCVGSA